MLSRQYQACSLTPVTGSGSISEALAAAVSLLKHLRHTIWARPGKSMVVVPLGEAGGGRWGWEPWRSVCSWGVCHAARCAELRAAGDSGVCSAGPAGCFYKGGDPLLHNAHTHTHTYTHTHMREHTQVLTGFFLLWRRRVTWSVHHASLRNMFGMQSVGRSQCSGGAFPVTSVWCLLRGSQAHTPSPLCCQSVRRLAQKSGVFWSGPPGLRGTSTHTFPTGSSRRRRPDTRSQFRVVTVTVWLFPARKNK